MDTVDLVVACAGLVYSALGTGHSESVYHRAMEVELRARVVRFETKVIVPISYRGLNVGYGEADLIVYTDQEPDGLVVELKATTYAPRSQERAQLQSYLRARNTDRGVLVNFRQPTATTPAPDQVDYEEVYLVRHEGVVTPSHAKEESKTNDDQQDESKGKRC